MPTINKRFLLQLLLATAVLAGALVGAHAVQARRIPDALKRQADRAAEAGKPDQAVHYLRQYLEFRPDDTDALERLSALLKERGRSDPRQQLLIYDKVLRADPDRAQVRRDALTLCLRIGRYADAEAHADILLKDHPNDADLWQKLAAAQAGLQKSADARKSYEAAIKADPTDPLPYQRLAQYLLRDLHQPPEARKVIEQLVAALPLDAEAYLTRAKFLLATAEADKPADPVPDLKKALELDPENAEALLLLAEQYQKRKNLAAAHDCLAAGQRLYPHDQRMVRSLAWLELNRGNIGAAVGVLEDGLARVKDGTDLLVPLGDLLVSLGETDRTAEIVKKLEASRHPSAPLQVKYLKARLAMRAADWAAAAAILTDLRTLAVKLPGLEIQANLLLAVCHNRQGNTPQEQETLKLLLSKDPNHLPGRVALAQSYLSTGRTKEAIKEYQTAVRSPFASPQTHATLVRLMARNLKLSGGRPQDWKQLEAVAAELARAYGPSSSEPILLRAEVAEAKGDLMQAAAILRAESARRPGDARLWAALADKVADLAGVHAGLGVLDEGQAAAGDGPDLRLARADLSARDPARLRPLDPLAALIDTWSDADQIKLLFGLVEVYDRLGDDAKALQTYRRIAARRPADVGVWEAFAERAARGGDQKSVAEARGVLSKLDPSGKSVALCDTWAALAANQAEAAKGAADGLVRLFGPSPDRAEACVALARVKVLTGDPGEASRLFERAVRLDPGRFPPMQAYLAHLTRTGADDAAAEVVGRLARDPRWAGEPFRRAVLGAARQLPPDAARRLFAAARPVVEAEPGGLGWLGDAYLAAGLKDDARDCFTKAVAAKGATPDDWLRLAVRSGTAGPEVLRAAREKLPPPQFFSTAAHFAESPAAPGGWAPEFAGDAEKKLFAQARLSLKLSRFQRSEAIALLEGFLKDAPPAGSDAAWARRNLAMLLAVRGGQGDRQKAMNLLLESDGKVGETADEKRSTAAVLTALSRHLDGDNRKAVMDRATKVLEGLVAETRSPRDAYLLAQLYRAAGNRTASTTVLNELLQADPKNLDYHVMALEELAELGQFKDAQPFADRILALYPTDYRAVVAAARFEAKAGRPERAMVLAEGYIRTADASAGDLPAKSARAAELLDELTRLPNVRKTEAAKRMAAAAVARYEELIPTRPEAVVAAAGLLAAADRHADAFALIEKHGKNLPPRLRARAGLSALRAGGATERHFSVVRAWLDAALKEEQDSIALKLDEGEFFSLRNMYPEAEQAYQAVLDRDPRNVVALNNLAWILAPNPQTAAKALALVDRAVTEVGLTGELLDTRARVRIAAKQFELAEKDLVEALSQEKTPLRMFHLALAKDGQTPPRKDEARDAFRKAKERGLDPKSVHPADLPMYKAFDAEKAN